MLMCDRFAGVLPEDAGSGGWESFHRGSVVGSASPADSSPYGGDAHVAWISLPSMSMAGEDDFELVAASLRADVGDLVAFVEALAVKLEQALPQRTIKAANCRGAPGLDERAVDDVMPESP